MSHFDTYKNLHVLCTISFVLGVTLVTLHTNLLDLLRKLHKGLILLPCAFLFFGLSSKAQSIGCDGFGYLVENSGTPTKQYLVQIDISSGVSEIVDNENEFEEKDFGKVPQKPKKKQAQNIKKARKNERKRKSVAKKRRRK